MGVAVDSIQGTGIGGRIVLRDVLEFAGKAQEAPAPIQAPVSAKTIAETAPTERREKLRGLRKVVAERMSRSHAEIPAVTQSMKVDVTELELLRGKINEGRERKISFNDFVLRATAKALAANKHILVSLDGDGIVFHERVNLGVAVATPDGLIVPVIRDADRLSLEAISCAARDLATRAREGKLGLDEYKGSTFTVSNLGMLGIETFTPIINQPEAAILGVCEIQEELALVVGAVVARKKIRISLTYDHRLMDGAVAARFELAVRELLERPLDILL